MYYANLFKHHLIIACIGSFFISGCSNTKQVKPVSQEAPIQTSHSISEEELEQLKVSSQQWQAAKPGVERLLIIEQDLKLLINQLNAVAKQNSSTTSTKELKTPAATQKMAAYSQDNPNNVIASKEDKEKRDFKALFALQVAAVTDKNRVSQSFNEIKARASTIFKGEFVANVEDINLGGIIYHRLKLGAYQKQDNAAADCDKLKQRNISCIVSYYTQKPLQ